MQRRQVAKRNNYLTLGGCRADSQFYPIAFLCALVGAALVGVNAWAAEPQHIPVPQLGSDFKLVGKLHWPLGKYITVQGVVVEGPFKGMEGGPNLRPQRIHGRATQEDTQLPIKPYFNKWGEKAMHGHALPKLEIGKTYEMEGYETGGYVGTPSEAYKKAEIALQTTGHYFRTQFVVVKAKPIEPIAFGPSDFEGRKALLHGTARTAENQALMEGSGWTVIVDPHAGWPKDIEGKNIETYGMYNSDADRKRFSLIDGNWRLVDLEDQFGRAVTLRGRARSRNDVWWFHYRGRDIYVENMADLPGWTPENHWRPMVIRGTLEKAKLPRLDQVTQKVDRDLADYFIVRKPAWQPIPALLAPERPIDEPE